MRKNTNFSKKPAVSPISYLYFTLFFISGVSGLIYESIWSQYLRQFLGHAAYAQTLVLVIYMGGMALGAWLTSLWAVKMRNLLLGYAIVEIALGIFALCFHEAFVAYLDVSFAAVIPSLGNPALISFYKWITASLIILPQSMLLGATFPLMAGGILRRFPGLSGYKTSVIYFVNTFGASIGVLVSGFYLVKIWGLEGAIVTGGVIDLFVGVSILCLWMYDKKAPEKASMVRDDTAVSTSTGDTVNTGNAAPVLNTCPADRRSYYYPLLAIACITAVSSFIYEIAWIRMLSLVLGSSTHSFELMLSAFILGLALGSLFIRNKLDSIKNAPRFLGIVKIIMGITAILTLFTYNNMFKIMAIVMDTLDKTDGGYLHFNVVSHAICMIIMLPSTICAGMVVPLIIHMLYRRGYGEQSIGKVYAVNTAGGIIGVVMAMWVLMELVGLKYLIIIGGAIDMMIGIYAFCRFREARGRLTKAIALPACLLVLIVSVAFAKIDPVLASSGVFRYGTTQIVDRVIAHKDGKTASISLFEYGNYWVLSTNGKPDANVGMAGNFGIDEYSRSLTGILPLTVREKTQTVAVIGMGSGTTVHNMLYDPVLELLDVIEIEPAVLALAKKIGPKVENAFNDPRCHIHIEDAKTFFSARNRTYDVIISEPSNPWVSGVSSLFTKEFYSHIRRHINDGGLFVQWFHKRESDVTIMVSILKALGESFPVYEMYISGLDLLVVAAKDPDTDISIKRDIFQFAPMAERLNAIGFAGLDDFRSLWFADKKFLDPFIHTYVTPPNSDYHPYIDLNAVKYRFLSTRINELDHLQEFIIPVRKIITADTGYRNFVLNRAQPGIAYSLARVERAKILALELTQSAAIDTMGTVKESSFAPIFTTLNNASLRPEEVTFQQIQNTIMQIMTGTLPYLSAKEMREIWEVIEVKVSNRQLTDNDAMWLAYYKSLCNYDIREARRLSSDLLPQGADTISNTYVNQMLLASLLASSVALGDTAGVGQIWDKYTEKSYPPTSLRAAKSLMHDSDRGD